MRTVIDKYTGQVLYCVAINDWTPQLDNEITIEDVLTEHFNNPYWDFENNIFYDKQEIV